MSQMLLILFVLQFIFNAYGQQLESPCPTIFNYDSNKVLGDTWSGNVTLKIESDVPGVWLSILFDKPPISVHSDYGGVLRIQGLEYLIRKTESVNAGSTENVIFSVKFDPGQPAPKLSGIRFTNKIVCPTDGVLQVNTLTSPCPDFFTYEPQTENNKWSGVIQLKSDVFLPEVTVKIYLDRKANDLGNWFGEAMSTDNKEFTISNEDVQLAPGSSEELKFFVTYNPNGLVPKVLAFSLNDKFLCGESNVKKDVPAVANGPQENGDLGFITADWVTETSLLDKFAESICGKVPQKAKPLITNSTPTEAGEWPWHAAIFSTLGPKNYLCGGTLITKFHVITAGHCVLNRQKQQTEPSSRKIYLGKYHLRATDKHEKAYGASSIILHPEYDSEKLRNDIALIKLDNPVDYNDFIRPVCLWRGSIELNAIVNIEGTVFGWGFTENFTVADTLRKTNAPVVPTTTCIYSNRPFFSEYTNEKNFCAGYRNGSGVCSGDSGGGLMFKNKYGEWEIRGIVSLSATVDNSKCDTSQFAIFTDIAQYLPWIVGSLKS